MSDTDNGQLNQESATTIDQFISERIIAQGNFDILKATSKLPFRSVLDVGYGKGGASIFFALIGRQVDAITVGDEFIEPAREFFEVLDVHAYDVAFEKYNPNHRYDALWLSHILEHSMNTGVTLQKAYDLLEDNGWLFLSVPPFKPTVVKFHVNVGWNVGLLMYNLILNGFDARNGRFIKHGYNITAFVRKGNPLSEKIKEGAVPEELTPLIFSKDMAGEFWPDSVIELFNANNAFNGDLAQVNWFEDFDTFASQPLSELDSFSAEGAGNILRSVKAS